MEHALDRTLDRSVTSVNTRLRRRPGRRWPQSGRCETVSASVGPKLRSDAHAPMGIKWFLFVFHPHHLVNQLSGHGPPCVCVCVCVCSHVCACVWAGKSPCLVPPPVSAQHRHVTPPRLVRAPVSAQQLLPAYSELKCLACLALAASSAMASCVSETCPVASMWSTFWRSMISFSDIGLELLSTCGAQSGR